MLIRQNTRFDSSAQASMQATREKMGNLIVFTCNYGIFVTVHGLFIAMLINDFDSLTQLHFLWFQDVDMSILLPAWAIGTLFQILHALIGPVRHITQKELQSKIYSRIVPLHIFLFIGAAAIHVFDLPDLAIIIMVLIKLGIDISQLRSSHGQISSATI